MANRAHFAPEEWYHCYNRGVEKRRIFDTERDYQRFKQSLYLCNNVDAIHQDDLRDYAHERILQYPRSERLVAIGAYCLMPNHFHLLIKEKKKGGITRFMRKLGVAYTMYFNIKNERAGNLLMKPFRSKRVIDDRYFKHVAQYIHLNPVELFEPGWKLGKVRNFSALENRLRQFPHSSFIDYCGVNRPERVILDENAFNFLKDVSLTRDLIPKAMAYYQDVR